MSSQTTKKGKSKEVDTFSPWSDWAWDGPNSQWYRSRSGLDGKIEYDIPPADTAVDNTPRTATEFTGDTTTADPTYYRNDTYGYQDTSTSLDPLSNQLQRTSIADGPTPLVVGSPSYTCPPSSSKTTPQVTESFGYEETVPIDVVGSDPPVHGSHQAHYGVHYGDIQLTHPKTNLPFTSTSSTSPTSVAHTSNTSTSIVAHKVISGTEGNEETLDPNFHIHNSRHFKPGHVFKVLWSEPGGVTSSSTKVTQYTVTRFGEQVHSTIRRFIIVAADHGHCQCVPVLTYQYQGTAKEGVIPEDHAIIYVAGQPPSILHGENTLSKSPIEMIPKSPRHKLDAASRINYAKIYTVEHNVKVCFIGHIAQSSRLQLMRDFNETWNKKWQMGGSY